MGDAQVTEEELREVEARVAKQRKLSAYCEWVRECVKDRAKLAAEVRRLRLGLENERTLRSCRHEPQSDSLSPTYWSCRKCHQPCGGHG